MQVGAVRALAQGRKRAQPRIRAWELSTPKQSTRLSDAVCDSPGTSSRETALRSADRRLAFGRYRTISHTERTSKSFPPVAPPCSMDRQTRPGAATWLNATMLAPVAV